MTVYIEYVLLDNVIIDYLLIDCALSLSLINKKWWRVGICAVFGGIFALIFPLINIDGIYLTIIKILFGAVMLLCSTKFLNKKQIYVSLLTFFFLTFCLGGAIMGISMIFNIDYNSEILISIIFLPAYVLIKSIKGIVTSALKRQRIKNCIFDCKIINQEKEISAKGLLDTGNNAHVDNNPIVFVDKNIATKLLTIKNQKIKQVEVATILGKKQISTFFVDSLTVYFNGQAHTYNNVAIGVVNQRFIDYSIILNPNLVKENLYEDYSVSKKIS